MRIGFFATEADERDVWRLVFAIPDMRVFERSSSGERPLREFAHPEQIFEARATGRLNGVSAVPLSAGRQPEYATIAHDDATAREGYGRWRHELRSPTMISFSRFKPPETDCLRECTFTAWSEVGARDRSIYREEDLDAVEWKKFVSAFRKLQRQIDGLAVAKLGSARILPDAMKKLVAGEITLWGWGQEISIMSPGVSIKAMKLN